MPINRPPGDDRRSAWYRPLEITAQEQRILTLADALLTWMTVVDWGPTTPAISDFMMHTNHWNPARKQLDLGANHKVWMLEKTDPDANRLFLELLQAAWHLRAWRVRYGELPSHGPG